MIVAALDVLSCGAFAMVEVSAWSSHNAGGLPPSIKMKWILFCRFRGLWGAWGLNNVEGYTWLSLLLACGSHRFLDNVCDFLEQWIQYDLAFYSSSEAAGLLRGLFCGHLERKVFVNTTLEASDCHILPSLANWLCWTFHFLTLVHQEFSATTKQIPQSFQLLFFPYFTNAKDIMEALVSLQPAIGSKSPQVKFLVITRLQHARDLQYSFHTGDGVLTAIELGSDPTWELYLRNC